MLDITAFSNALRHGTVSFLDSLQVRPFIDDGGNVVSFTGEDAVVYPLVGAGERAEYALRLPLEHNSGRAWPVQYADLATTVGTIEPFLPSGITILDVEDIPGTGVALVYDWVPGETITARVAHARSRHDRDRLTELLWPLADIADALRVSGMVHGDIAPGNIVVRPDGGMALVDLDRMGYRDADGSVEPRRRAGYRLPRGGGSPVEEDAFALLVLMTTCGVLADANVPTDHERVQEASHPTLLFSSWDLMDPQRSRLVRDIEDQLSPLSRALLDLLVSASTGPSERVPGLVREAIRHIHRFCTRPDPLEIEPAPDHPQWHPASDSGAARSVSGVKAEPEPGPRQDEHRDADLGEWWPQVHHAPEPTNRPAITARPAGHRSVSAILDDLRANLVVEPKRAGASRRAARAERRRQTVAEQLRRALEQNDRAVLVRLAMSGALAELGDSERSDLLQVVRALAHESISRAIESDDDGMIAAAIDDSVFQRESDLDPAFRERVRIARDRERWADRLLASVREGDARACGTLLSDAPPEALDRLPASIRAQADRLVKGREAEAAATEAIRSRDADGLAQALGRLVTVRPTWTYHVDPGAVVALLSEEQIEHRLVASLAGRTLSDEDQWMVDIVIAAGRLPEVTRLAGLAPRDVEAMIYREV